MNDSIYAFAWVSLLLFAAVIGVTALIDRWLKTRCRFCKWPRSEGHRGDCPRVLEAKQKERYY
jgi:hypothetical protein